MCEDAKDLFQYVPQPGFVADDIKPVLTAAHRQSNLPAKLRLPCSPVKKLRIIVSVTFKVVIS